MKDEKFFASLISTLLVVLFLQTRAVYIALLLSCIVFVIVKFKSLKKVVFLSSLIALTTCCFIVLLNAIDIESDSYVNRSLFSGIEWVAEKSGKIVLSGKSGYQNFEQKKSIPENAIYRIYSMTKPITSVMALKLIERGKLRLYDPVSSFIPSFEKLKVMNPDGSLEELNRPMIIEDLLTHRSGFTYDFLMGCHVAPLYSERDISDSKASNRNIMF